MYLTYSKCICQLLLDYAAIAAVWNFSGLQHRCISCLHHILSAVDWLHFWNPGWRSSPCMGYIVIMAEIKEQENWCKHAKTFKASPQSWAVSHHSCHWPKQVIWSSSLSVCRGCIYSPPTGGIASHLYNPLKEWQGTVNNWELIYSTTGRNQ